MTPNEIRALDVGSAWRAAAQTVLDCGGEAFHLAVRVAADADDADVRRGVDQLVRSQNMQPIETVANTIFPSALARSCPEPRDLAARYRAVYPRLRTYARNRNGTYFGRLVDHPDGGLRANQLVHVVDKLRDELASSRRTSRYECSIYHPATDAHRPMGFPCLSSMAFHLDVRADAVHLAATYRNQHLVERGYGNYLGLARLRNYVAAAAELEPGELMVIAGHARVDGRRTELKALLGTLDATKGPV